MTIFTSKICDEKDTNDLPPPEVVTDSMLLIENVKNQLNSFKNPPYPVFVEKSKKFERDNLIINRIRQYGVVHVCLALIILPLALALFTGFIWLYKHVNKPEEPAFIGRCGVGFYHMSHFDDPMIPSHGKFIQDVKIEKNYERISVPPIGNVKQTITFHDFNLNITAIIDEAKEACFIIPLNRTLVKPPRDFVDLLIKIGKGDIVFNIEVLKTNYKVMTPAINDLTVFGPVIEKNCKSFETFRLAKEGDPVALSKRSACQFAESNYCLGQGGTPYMECISIDGCY